MSDYVVEGINEIIRSHSKGDEVYHYFNHTSLESKLTKFLYSLYLKKEFIQNYSIQSMRMDNRKRAISIAYSTFEGGFAHATFPCLENEI